MAASRSHRSTAGNRLARLLNQEDAAVEEFYETAYGGFKNEENDDEYVTLEDGEDIVDSDFSNAEDEDEQVSDHGNDEDQRKRKKPMKYKEPTKTESIQPKPAKKLKTEKETEREAARKDADADADAETSGAGVTSSDDLGLERMSKRKSTAAKTAATKERVKERKLRKKSTKIEVEERVFTQEELLAEAKETEIENLKSLEKYEQLENERKAKRAIKKTPTCPMIRYHSKRVSVGNKTGAAAAAAAGNDARFKAKTFVSFLNDPNDDLFNRTFEPLTTRRQVRQELCPITGLPALYIDPVTSLPYRNIIAFRIIREAYYQQLETNGDRDNTDVSRWLDWRESSKEKCRKIAKNIIEYCKERQNALAATVAAGTAKQTTVAEPATGTTTSQ